MVIWDPYQIQWKFIKFYYHLEGHVFKLGLVDTAGCNRGKQASEMDSHVLCDCELVAVLSFRQPSNQFSQPGYFPNISFSKELGFV